MRAEAAAPAAAFAAASSGCSFAHFTASSASGRGFRALLGFPKRIYDDIEKLQPYHRGNSQDHARQALLAQLAWLNNADKHRILHLAFGVATDEPLGVSFDNADLIASVEQEVLESTLGAVLPWAGRRPQRFDRLLLLEGRLLQRQRELQLRNDETVRFPEGAARSAVAVSSTTAL